MSKKPVKKPVKKTKKVNPVYCGLGPVPKGRRRAFMQPCASQGEISYYGYQQLPANYIKLVPGFEGTPLPSKVGRPAAVRAPVVRRSTVKKAPTKKSGSKTAVKKAPTKKSGSKTSVRKTPPAVNSWQAEVAATEKAIFKHNECFATRQNAMIVASAIRKGMYKNVPSAVETMADEDIIKPVSARICKKGFRIDKKKR